MPFARQMASHASTAPCPTGSLAGLVLTLFEFDAVEAVHAHLQTLRIIQADRALQWPERRDELRFFSFGPKPNATDAERGVELAAEERLKKKGCPQRTIKNPNSSPSTGQRWRTNALRGAPVLV